MNVDLSNALMACLFSPRILSGHWRLAPIGWRESCRQEASETCRYHLQGFNPSPVDIIFKDLILRQILVVVKHSLNNIEYHIAYLVKPISPK